MTKNLEEILKTLRDGTRVQLLLEGNHVTGFENKVVGYLTIEEMSILFEEIARLRADADRLAEALGRLKWEDCWCGSEDNGEIVTTADGKRVHYMYCELASKALAAHEGKGEG